MCTSVITKTSATQLTNGCRKGGVSIPILLHLTTITCYSKAVSDAPHHHARVRSAVVWVCWLAHTKLRPITSSNLDARTSYTTPHTHSTKRRQPAVQFLVLAPAAPPHHQIIPNDASSISSARTKLPTHTQITPNDDGSILDARTRIPTHTKATTPDGSNPDGRTKCTTHTRIQPSDDGSNHDGRTRYPPTSSTFFSSSPR